MSAPQPSNHDGQKSALIRRKPSRVYRDDLPPPLPLGVHRTLQWVGVALLSAVLVLSALFRRGVITVEGIAARLS